MNMRPSNFLTQCVLCVCLCGEGRLGSVQQRKSLLPSIVCLLLKGVLLNKTVCKGCLRYYMYGLTVKKTTAFPKLYSLFGFPLVNQAIIVWFLYARSSTPFLPCLLNNHNLKLNCTVVVSFHNCQFPCCKEAQC